ncbi:transcriptional regulator [Mycobacterium kansasii]|uniref:Trifunctional NAD biosynthesis/regulator protein NadR n=1 Tax=Mycobacterium attenuatum TaxID=2341086 RepID=A0A498PQ55_9MYCO|nr:AAA family ATPase [Mycobacterium attenuatum]ORB84905.1 transcriptional regulator [Mycobacterium kansasii]VBA31850.1 Trifunctional NAD biosynthesis/regulator protein NadR [Mycobacterium attenuatum]VBA44778.1 Trifunctional NAD biosynthesis/regulator protein NadR [Mycobacterium attenuatum]
MTHGMVLGRFVPPHAGHVYLCEFARQWVDDLTIVISVRARDPISGNQRLAWMRELFPFDRVIDLFMKEMQHPSEQPPSRALLKASLEKVLSVRPDFVFASEPYGADLAQVLGARFVSVDQARTVVPVSATCIRADPFAHWQHIPRCVRPTFVKRVSILGPEPTATSALARVLAEKLGTKWVPEWSRAPMGLKAGTSAGPDWIAIVRGQIASEEALARDSDRVLICATDPLATTVWAELLLGSCPQELRQLACRPYDLTLLMTADAPSDAAAQAYPLSGGVDFVGGCERALRAAKRPFVVVSGGWEERTAAALGAVEKLTLSHRSWESR